MTEASRSQKSLRRTMAKASMILTWVITIAFLLGLTDNAIADRVVKVWPPFTVLFPSLMGYIAWFAKLGSDEARREMDMSAKEQR